MSLITINITEIDFFVIYILILILRQKIVNLMNIMANLKMEDTMEKE